MDFKETIGKHIRAEREKRGISQQKLADAVGWSTHQIVLNVESGQREVKAWELAIIAKFLGVHMADLLEVAGTEKELPFVLWREVPKEREPETRAKFLKHCEDYYFLEQSLGVLNQSIRPLPFLEKDILESSYGDAEGYANFVRESFNLGHYPAVTLAKTMEDYYGVKFLQFDLGSNGSAASTKSNLGVCVLVNSCEIPWRQNFSVAHELFHILTWNEPLFRERAQEAKFKEQNEKLANTFAAALLMPEEAIREEMRRIEAREGFQFSDLVSIARKFDVSSKALLYRLANLHFISNETRDELKDDPEFQSIDKESFQKHACAANRLGDRFIRLGYQAYNREIISRSRLSDILDVPLGSLKNYLEEKGFPESASHEITLCHS